MSVEVDNRFVDNMSPPAVTRADIKQIEHFFLSLKSKVYVCPALCNLYFATLEDMANLGGWELQTTGFPTVIFDTGALRREPKLQLCIAQKGSGFIQWMDMLGEKTNYKAPGKKFHTMNIMNDSKKIAGLSFDDETAAVELFQTVQAWINEKCELDRENMDGADKKKKKKKPKVSKVILPKKETISLPCQFEHITRIDHKQFSRKHSSSSLDRNDSEQVYDQHARIVTNGKKIPYGYAESTSTEDSGLDEV